MSLGTKLCITSHVIFDFTGTLRWAPAADRRVFGFHKFVQPDMVMTYSEKKSFVSFRQVRKNIIKEKQKGIYLPEFPNLSDKIFVPVCIRHRQRLGVVLRDYRGFGCCRGWDESEVSPSSGEQPIPNRVFEMLLQWMTETFEKYFLHIRDVPLKGCYFWYITTFNNINILQSMFVILKLRVYEDILVVIISDWSNRIWTAFSYP